MSDEMTLVELGDLRTALRAKLKTVTAQVEEKALKELAAGRSEAEVAREARVDRMTVRTWRGKR